MRLNCLTAGVLACAVLTGCKTSTRCELSRVRPASENEYTIRSMDDLVRMNRCDLENLYRHAEIGCPPSGVYNGRAIINAGSTVTVPASKVVRVLWQGKVVTDDDMVNRVFGMRAVHARVYTGESWLDGQQSVIFDYSGAAKLFPDFRDEVREIAPGLYLGLMHKRTETGTEFKTFFALESR